MSPDRGESSSVATYLVVQDDGMAEDPGRLVAEQLRYYRARAGEYDATSYGAVSSERASVSTIVDRLGISGDVVELACGTGIWTAELVRHAATLTALDGAPEMLEIARRRVPASVRFEQADLFDWMPAWSWDVVFFSAWLSHVPAERFESFWSRVADALRPGGRVIALDELPARAVHEDHIDGEVAIRTLQDGSRHEIVKVFWEPGLLVERLAALGWRATVAPIEHDWFVLEARR
jgi:demethylmenaquinone methyltransferase/2-methoxy-6-polyprenyl-1,4-benzoquinol methylase